MKKPVLLAIMDGFGLREEHQGNAVYEANKPNLLGLKEKYTWTTLRADGEYVGLPEGQMGNSEVGHLNIGAGRVVHQSLNLINLAIKTEDFYQNKEYQKAINNVKENGTALHIIGLLSNGGVHSHIEHILAMLEMAKRENLDKVYVHPILDGRDVDPKSAKEFLQKLITFMDENQIGEIGSLSGRYYSMDRDKRWDRVEKAYNAIVLGKTEEEIDDEMKYIDNQYAKEIYDEFIEPAAKKGYPGIKDKDSVVFMNFRPDRAMQLSAVLTNPEYNPQEENPIFKPIYRPQNICFVQTMKYSDDVLGGIAFANPKLTNTLGDVVSEHGMKQLRIAETEKYPHVTFFFDGGVDKEIKGSKRILVNSPKVATYDLQPEMSAYEVTDRLLDELSKGDLDLIILNFANADMVGHSGMLEPTKRAIEVVDECIGKIVEKIEEMHGSVLITADHGNSDKVTNTDGTPNTAHTSNPVPLLLVDENRKLNSETGALCDIAPTLLELLGIEQPKEMTGHSLLK